MLHRAVEWDPPLLVTVVALFTVSGVVSLAVGGEVTWYAVLLAAVCSGAQWARRRRHHRAQIAATRSDG
ncbi:hypothetical protein [Nocardioides flavescens]|uniref:Uncharacterized protein n=1 Tax=Nocardioides flavescens TaxID=2691959 RepID=A0A6L7EXL6_9ACTN|nr:hypothetical protein [Nocardioides flavescens]MXG88819.1 hypothetical protein [Nocardioides flavescens]